MDAAFRSLGLAFGCGFPVSGMSVLPVFAGKEISLKWDRPKRAPAGRGWTSFELSVARAGRGSQWQETAGLKIEGIAITQTTQPCSVLCPITHLLPLTTRTRTFPAHKQAHATATDRIATHRRWQTKFRRGKAKLPIEISSGAMDRNRESDEAEHKQRTKRQ